MSASIQYTEFFFQELKTTTFSVRADSYTLGDCSLICSPVHLEQEFQQRGQTPELDSEWLPSFSKFAITIQLFYF
ncbi:unnamed protein product (macronuclear) [Paramecium tetraurelia]|uniref:Uncharacterized protein n=1 Tax=Paramecium tetraurelia TaxID=5888 RepID=A0CQ03_PARTE|nr:uncharacterized protein GSPATT00038827001 [Paramecium tetraurelia]CAK72870.1 unnamed protein product [Paramecium tetraurelia]|eukprot:XP_001440267.1 hypothetical protein (macronuclear) [Paramecium tetraurelia strain d4-2]